MMNKILIEWKDEAQVLSHYSPDTHYLPVLAFLLSSCLYMYQCLTSGLAWHGMARHDLHRQYCAVRKLSLAN